ncbi:hypothetical protein [uncultured Prevotella sp.]|uniref:hypothetical protein n=1 Tax=uncultured Prevotella sp. TaxID=159272 RepID=UPI0026310F1D|nr:hypothetical protein [uncultured Prevotella sp.]
MIVHLDKEQTRQMRRKLLADNSDIVFVLFHDTLKQLHTDGETQLSAVEAFLSARQFAQTLLSMNEAMEGLEDELDDLEDDAYGKNDAMIISIVACAIIKAFAKAHATSVYDEVVKAILIRWNDHPLFFPMLAGAARKEERRFAENKRNDLLRYELEQAVGDGDGKQAVREIVETAKETDVECIKSLLFVLGKLNVAHSNMYDSEYNDLYDVYVKKTQVVYSFKSLNDIHDNQEVKIGK